MILSRLPIPGLFVTGTDTGVGKTIIAGAIADSLRRRGQRVGVCKIAATGCLWRREGLVSEDAEFLAACADTPHSLDLICPQRFQEPLAPAVAAERAGQPLDWSAIDRALQQMCHGRQVMVVEGVGGIRVPMDEAHTVLDVASALRLPCVVVARAGLGTINHTLLTLDALRRAEVPIAGVVINQYPSDTPGAAEESNPKAIEKWGNVRVLTLVPRCAQASFPLPQAITTAVDGVDWQRLLEPDDH
jgi:dethiobiotin synthetase